MNQEIIAGIVIGIIGLMLLLVPSESIWYFTEKWKSEGAEKPTKWYVLLLKGLGALFAFVGGGLIVYGGILV